MEFEQTGYKVLERVISDSLCKDLIEALPYVERSGSSLLLFLAPFLKLGALARGGFSTTYLRRGSCRMVTLGTPPPDNSMQMYQIRLSHLLLSHEPRQLALAADLGR